MASSSPRALNQPRWNGGHGRYEAWYVKCNEPERDASAWLRYSLLKPSDGDGVAQVWAIVNGPDGSTEAQRVDAPLDDLTLGTEPIYSSPHGTLSDTGCSGEAGNVSWDLEWRPSKYAFTHLPGILYSLPGVRTRTATPNPDIPVTGQITVGLETWELEAAPGQQGHVWGSKHGDGWAWAHASAGDGPTWEALSAQLPGPLRRFGPLTMVLVRHEGETLAIRGIRRTDSAWSTQGWNLEARDGDTRIEIEVANEPKRMDGVTYTDPDGEASFCHNTKRADARLRLLERTGGGWEETGSWTWERSTAFEVGDRTRDDGVPWVLD